MIGTGGDRQRPFKLFIIAGETSGDLLAASFVAAIRARLAPRSVEITGVGGPSLQSLGLEPLFAQADIQLMGILAVLKRLPTVLSHINASVDAIVDMQPDLILTVDVPDFSMRVAKKVRRQLPAIPIVHWVAPSVWAWRPGRAKAMKPHVDRLLALLPFEPEALSRLGGPITTYVGHPLLDQVALLRPSPDERRLRDNVVAPVILVLPGSRRSEVRHLLPVFRETIMLVAARFPHARYVIPAVPHLASAIAENVANWTIKPEIIVGDDAKHAAFRRARVALAASGTVTLELALAGIPLVGAYRGHAIEAFVAKKLVKSHSVLLCNLVLGRNIAPELMQNDATAQALASHLINLLDDGPHRQAQIDAFATLDQMMALPCGRRSADAAVDVALDLVDQKKS